MASGKIAIVGSGLIGRAWAITFARAGMTVALYDATPGAAEAAVGFIREVAGSLAEAGQTKGQTADELCARIGVDPDLAAALDGAVHVQENTPEVLEIKQQLYVELDRLTPVAATIASSTSGLVPSLFTEPLPNRARCLVAHPINPPYLVPAVEVVPAPWTSPEAVAAVAALMRTAGQSPIVMKKEIDGFVMNRLQGALLHEAFRLVAEGYAGMEDIDIGIRDGLGLRWSFMGPFETIDLNAPGGMADYVHRFGGMYARMFEGQRHRVDWTAPADAMAAEAAEGRPRDKLGERQIWRDRRLMALLNHKRDAGSRFGN